MVYLMMRGWYILVNGIKKNIKIVKMKTVFHAGIKARFHQYFVHGQMIDCTQWQNDFKNCMDWRRYRDIDAFKNVLESERNRIFQRQAAAQANDSWELRDEPPEDWNKPLPDWLQKEHNSYLKLKQKERIGASETSSCVCGYFQVLY
ncbi:synaptic plasticity regulator PANTS isoform X5 [Tachypleus tridentatus]|uniref:synaptic plasticity regulator PANTS isoform X5 n=1 Tax=Tachypleus tridentatus TaxID=6853 RepID=UPI003FD507D9